MKKIYLLAAMAVPALFTACSNEDMDLTSTQEVDGMVKVADLDLTVGFAGQAESRADYILNDAGTAYGFYWNDENDLIGMSLVNEGTTPLTNYSFKVDSLKLADYKATLAAGAVLTGTTTKRTTGYYNVAEGLSTVQEAYTKSNDAALTTDDLGKSKFAKFGTSNETILGGKYIVYYPYSLAFKDPSNGNIPVSMSVAQYQSKVVAENMKFAAKNTFAYSPEKWTVAGGVKCEAFELVPATGVLQIMIGNADDAAANITKVILKAKDESKFYTKAELNGIPAETAAASTLFTNFDAATAVDILTLDVANAYTTSTPTVGTTEYVTVAVGADVDEATPMNIAIFPGTYSFDIILVNEAGKGLTIPVEDAVTVNNKAKRVKIEIPEDAVFDEYIVTTEAELNAALSGVSAASTIKLLKPVTCAAGVNYAGTYDLTFEGEDIVFGSTFASAANVTFDNNVTFKGVVATAKDLTFNASAIFAKIGALPTTTAQADMTGNITVGTEGTLSLNNSLTMSAKKLLVNGTLNVNAGDLRLPESSNMYVEGDVVVATGAEVNNSGKIQVLGSFTNNGDFVKAIATASYEGVALVNNGEYTVTASTLEDVKMANADASITKIQISANILNALTADLTINKNVEISNDVATNGITNASVADAANLKKLTVNNLVITGTSATIKIATNVDVLGDLTIDATNTLRVMNSITVAVTGDLVNNGIFSIDNPAGNTYTKGVVTCAAFSGTGTWTSLPTVE